jgi:hypothetical protein
MASYIVSKDGKTVSVDGKTYSLTAFRKQFRIGFGSISPGSKGSAVPDKLAKQPIKINTEPKPSAGKTRMGSLGAGRAVGLSGGMNWQTK